MIRSFICKETEKIFNREFSKSLLRNIQGIARRKLLMINRAIDVNDLKAPPGNRLEKLQFDLEIAEDLLAETIEREVKPYHKAA